ncbi:MAG: Crp/Fnr family transcriptional regulator [Bacteroidota bacterium]|nr:Crp/Fnr family transcriptional regulator [Bacteroidota bacterium]MDP4215312.1 Crp/Fnr family transcriptional regulator [Bacteroidota bacterium]MDP4247205.1 Crp/Fnr family transcriptional regulator [Bacteroidota bacterium]MDP4252875.1 Crp/Fnr family transcriptional regulator [Bacteroidota bacterium]MDP4259136.1 Crp/Fnr family transcriptional regulator [Bacteroidota bacterium]
MHEIFKSYLTGQIKLTNEQWQLVFRLWKPTVTKRGEVLLQKGKVSHNTYFVVKGCLGIFLSGDDGHEYTRFLVFEGKFGSAFPSFTTRKPSAASILSIEASQILLLNYRDHQYLLDHIPGWERLFRINLEKEYIYSIQRIESLISMDAKRRYEILLEQNPKLIQRLPSKIVAGYLGISQETLSRLKSKK